MSSYQLMFFILSAIIIVFSMLAVTSRRILRAATYLLFVLIATSGLYFMLNYQYLAAVQLTLYAGGIVVLIIFSILLTSQIGTKFERLNAQKIVLSAVAVAAGIIVCLTSILDFKFQANEAVAKEINMDLIGKQLLNYGNEGYALPFEVISILLIAAMAGAIVIAKKGKKIEKDGSQKKNIDQK